MKTFFVSGVVLSSVLFAACGTQLQSGSAELKEAWNGANAPIRMSQNYVMAFDSLPKAGMLVSQAQPRSDTYWPSYRGGIATRWNSMYEESAFSYGLHSRERVLAMSSAELAQLSPSEKYDILMDRFDFPLTLAERSRNRPNSPAWEGLCHGWAAAALLYREPSPVVLRARSGVAIPFGSSDIKALLSYYQGQVARSRTEFLGERCEVSGETNLGSPACRDTNAGAFHVVLTNQIGLRRQGFIIDKTRNFEVWNQPVFAFSSTVIGTQGPSVGAAYGTVREVLLRTVVRYSVEVEPEWERIHSANVTEAYDYRVEINSAGQIVGGEWLSYNRPDFLWKQARNDMYGGYFAGLREVLRASGAL